MEEEDGFYQKLNKLNESSGLSLLFNFRNTSVDLHHLYKSVTEGGGYHQVTKDRKWEDLASSLNQQNQLVPFTPTQLQNLYTTILYPFEQTYHYRTPLKHNKVPITCNVSQGSRDFRYGEDLIRKRKLHNGLYTTECGVEYNHGFRKSSPAMDMVEEEKGVSRTLAKVKDTKGPSAPLGSRNCYQMFIKIECDRLKRIHGETPSAKLRDTVVEAWRHLSHDDKQPYIAASKKDKERFVREMAAYEEHKRTRLQTTTQNVINFSRPTLLAFTRTPSREAVGGSHVTPCHDPINPRVVDIAKPCSVQTDGDYHVALQPDDGQEIPRASNESMVQMAIGLMKNARPNDPIFQFNWDDEHCGSII